MLGILDLELITNVVGLTKRQLSEKFHLEPLEVRKMGVALLKAISEKKVLDAESLFDFISKELNLEPNFIDEPTPEKLLHVRLCCIYQGKSASMYWMFGKP